MLRMAINPWTPGGRLAAEVGKARSADGGIDGIVGMGDLERIEQRGEDVGRNVTHFKPAPRFEKLSV